MSYFKVLFVVITLLSSLSFARQDDDALYFVKAQASDKAGREKISSLGLALA